MQTIKGWLRNKASKSASQQQAQALSSDLQKLMGFLLGKQRAWLYANPDHALSAAQIKQMDQWHDLLLDQMPVAYITGQQDFWNLTLQVNQHTLVPRPDTELLVEVAIQLVDKPHNILDLGTGSGAIGLALAQAFPQAAVLGVDASRQALAVAQHNARTNHINNITFICSDWFTELESQTFDLIVSNPPYIASDDAHLSALKHEPQSALVAGAKGLRDFEVIAQHAPNHLIKDGVLLFEHGWQQKAQVQSILSKNGFMAIKTHQDLAGHDRVTVGFK